MIGGGRRMDTNTWIYILAGVVVVVVAIYIVMKEKANDKKALSGEDKKALAVIMNKFISEGETCTVAYATWEWTTFQGKSQTTQYWYYGIAFNSERIYIAPLSYDEGDISYKNPFVLEKGDIGIVNSKPGEIWVELYDKNQQEIISLMTAAKNLNDDKFHPINILQEEEHKAFIAWKDAWMEEINAVNGITVTGKMKRPVKKK